MNQINLKWPEETEANKDLREAILCNHLDAVECLLASGLAPLHPKHGEPPLQTAARHENLEIMEIILKFGADINYANPQHPSALAISLQRDRRASLYFLLERGATVGPLREKLQDVVTRMPAPSISFLIAVKPHLDFEDARLCASEASMLSLARRTGDHEVVDFLLTGQAEQRLAELQQETEGQNP